MVWGEEWPLLLQHFTSSANTCYVSLHNKPSPNLVAWTVITILFTNLPLGQRWVQISPLTIPPDKMALVFSQNCAQFWKLAQHIFLSSILRMNSYREGMSIPALNGEKSKELGAVIMFLSVFFSFVKHSQTIFDFCFLHLSIASLLFHSIIWFPLILSCNGNHSSLVIRSPHVTKPKGNVQLALSFSGVSAATDTVEFFL